MHSEHVFHNQPLRPGGMEPSSSVFDIGLTFPRKTAIGLILVVALLAFEIFNFDTTRYALQNLLGNVSFLRLRWASILAIAFCAIDFAGLARLFTPERGREEPRAVWYLMGAWLLGATMNAIMTWWAVSLTLLSHDFGNEVLGRETLLKTVPIFVAVLVWLTRILFIGAFSVAGEHIFDLAGSSDARPASRPQPQPQPATGLRLVKNQGPSRRPQPQPDFEMPPPQTGERPSPIQRRPPMPGAPGIRPTTPVGMQARGRNQN
jgi:hypothetical protein